MSTQYENAKNDAVHLTRFWGGSFKGICLQLTKHNSFTADPKQLALPECIGLKEHLQTVYNTLPDYDGVLYHLQHEVQVNKGQLKDIIQDLDLFILDDIHKDN